MPCNKRERPRSAMSRLIGNHQGQGHDHKTPEVTAGRGHPSRHLSHEQLPQQLILEQQQHLEQLSIDQELLAQAQRQREELKQLQETRDRSWIKRALIGRTPSLPSSLGKRKQSFLKVGWRVSVLMVCKRYKETYTAVNNGWCPRHVMYSGTEREPGIVGRVF